MPTKVAVRFFGDLGDITGKLEEEVTVEDPTLEALVSALHKSYGDKFTRFALDPGYIFLINGQAADVERRKNVKLADGDLVIITPALGGG